MSENKKYIDLTGLEYYTSLIKDKTIHKSDIVTIDSSTPTILESGKIYSITTNTTNDLINITFQDSADSHWIFYVNTSIEVPLWGNYTYSGDGYNWSGSNYMLTPGNYLFEKIHNHIQIKSL